ncbi:hypothetical protein [Polymorphospora sp. NPDC050346]|uniref:hypothetical protein n=1 Tax=Polymorphospora sp. NPDC050346 TaxID=3155780 RepID=UPI0033D97D23
MSRFLARHDEGFAEAAAIRHGRPVRGDDRVPEGVHWRVIPPSGTLPAGPVVVCDAPIDGHGESADVRTDRDGPWEVHREQDLILTIDEDPAWMTGWVGLQADGELRISVIAEKTAPNGEFIEITARDTVPGDQGPWVVASSDITRVRVTGEGIVIEAWARRIPRELERVGRVLDVAALDPDAADAMAGSYAPLNVGFESAKDRVLRAAPDQPVPYAPRFPWPEYTVDDEVHRVTELVEAGGTIRNWLRIAGEAIMAGRPGKVVQDVGGGQGLRYPVASALGVAAADPGVARWLARQGMFTDEGEHWRDGRLAMAVALVPMIVRRLPFLLRPSAALEELYERQVPGALDELRARVAAIPDPPEFDAGLFGRGPNGRAPLRRRWVVDLVQLPMPLVVEDSPALPRTPSPTVSGAPTWTLAEQVGAVPQRTDAWEQMIALRDVAPFGPVSFVQVAHAPGDPERITMHDHEAGSEVARSLLAGWPQPTTVRALPETDAVLRARVPLATPADARTVEWEVRLGDWIGRWGEPTRVVADPPPPAPPSPPVLRATFVREPATGTAPTSAGFVHIELVVAPTTAPGALPLGAVHLRIDGVSVPLATPDVTADRVTLTHDHPVPPTVPGQSRIVHVEAAVTDAAGTPSPAPDPAVDVRADDARPLPVPSVSPRLVMTGRPGPAPDTTVRLSVRAAPGAAFYRFYAAPESVVRAAVGLSPDGFRADPRPERAAALLARGRPPRKGFTLATSADVVDGIATGMLTVPGATTDLVLVRAVPVTGVVDAYGKKAEGVEADVATVAPAYVAVPFDDVPPLPRLTAEVVHDGDGRSAAVTATVSGVPADLLTRLPGRIEARLVEAIEGTDPYYWPEVAVLPLAAHDDGSHTGTAQVPVPTWARVRLAASVRFAAESTTVPDADIVIDPDLSSTAPQLEAIVSPWGPLSAPIAVDIDGPEPALTAAPDAAGTVVTVTGLPLMATGSSPFTAVVYVAGPDGSLSESASHPVVGENPSFTFAPAGSAAAVILIDPFGRSRPAVQLGI